MTVHLIDRYLQKVDVSKHELQLIGSTGTNIFLLKDIDLHKIRSVSLVNAPSRNL